MKRVNMKSLRAVPEEWSFLEMILEEQEQGI